MKGRYPMSAPIVVINPNSSAAVTSAIDRAVAPLRMAGGPSIECVTLADGPPGIETQAHVEQVVQPIRPPDRAAREDAAAFVIHFFSYLGLQLAREATARPVLGIAECGMLFRADAPASASASSRSSQARCRAIFATSASSALRRALRATCRSGSSA